MKTALSILQDDLKAINLEIFSLLYKLPTSAWTPAEKVHRLSFSEQRRDST